MMFIPWLTGLIGALVGRMAEFLVTKMVAEKAFHYALVTGFLVTVTAMFVTLTLTVKAAVIGARVVMPPILAQVTYWLPPSMPLMISTIITIRVSVAVYNWSVSVFSAYLPTTNGKFAAFKGVM